MRARRVVADAIVDPSTVCWRCGRALDDHPPHPDGSPARWQAGHLVDGDPMSPLAAEASTCNLRAGGRLGRVRQLAANRRAELNPSRRWW